MSALDTLLVVQDLDTTIDQLVHRRAALPERTALAEAEARIADVDARAAAVGATRDEIELRQAGLERDVAAVEARITEVDKRLYSGEVSASRDLQAMASEIESLKGRRSSLEDQVLASMEEAEPVDTELEALQEERRGYEAEVVRLQAAIAEAEAAIDAELGRQRSEREGTAAGIPDDLLAAYDRLRGRLGGIGAARLVGASCSGCHLTLPAVELDRIRHQPPDALVHCDQCGRILVR